MKLEGFVAGVSGTGMVTAYRTPLLDDTNDMVARSHNALITQSIREQEVISAAAADTGVDEATIRVIVTSPSLRLCPNPRCNQALERSLGCDHFKCGACGHKVHVRSPRACWLVWVKCPGASGANADRSARDACGLAVLLVQRWCGH